MTRNPRKYRLFLRFSGFGFRWQVCSVKFADEPLCVGPSGFSIAECREQVEAMQDAFSHPACVEIDPSNVEWPER